MSETKHTPGPWRVGEEAVEVFDASGKHVVWEVARCGSQVANAHLIAAAPDLLEALKLLAHPSISSSGVRGETMIGWQQSETPAWERIEIARAAIAKAEAKP